MSLSVGALPLAAGAGALGVLSPCVWPLVPVVMTSASQSGRGGAIALTAGLAIAFALAGTVLSFALVSLGLDPELFRYVAAILLIAIGATLLFRPLGDALALALSRLSGRLNTATAGAEQRAGPFALGLLLGIVWLPCVGPTLGAAIALASVGQSLPMAFAIMLAYGLGTGAVLLAAGLASNAVLKRSRPQVMERAGRAKAVLGGVLLLLGVLVLTGWDKVLETAALNILPAWVYSL